MCCVTCCACCGVKEKKKQNIPPSPSDVNDQTDDHLSDLADGKKLGPRGRLTAFGLEVIVIHERMDKRVHGREVDARRKSPVGRVPSEPHHRQMVIPVQERYRSLGILKKIDKMCDNFFKIKLNEREVAKNIIKKKDIE